MNILKPLLILALAILIGGCAPMYLDPIAPPAASSTVKPFSLKLIVRNTPQGQEVLEPNNAKSAKCTKFPDEDRYRKGCIVAEIDELVYVDVKLVGRPQWYFTAFQICATDVKLDDWDQCTINPAQRSDWMLIANNTIQFPAADGMVDLSASANAGAEEFNIVNFNLLSADYFYRIKACTNTGEARCLWMDPAAMNRGRGNLR
jgi:hypothetical protein